MSSLYHSNDGSVALPPASLRAMPSPTPDDPTAEIRRLREASNAAIAVHDAKLVASFVEDDVQITAGRGEKFSGRKSMRDRFAEQFRGRPDLRYIRTPGTVTISQAAPLASERGTWVGRWTEAGRLVELRGEYQAMWRQREGRWRIAAELFVLLKQSER